MTMVKCSNCSTLINKKPSFLKKYKMSFCNRNCRSLFWKKTSTKIEVPCTLCKTKVWRTNHQLRSSSYGYVFCCNLCKNKYIAKNLRHSTRKSPTKNHRCRRDTIINAAGNKCQVCSYSEDIRMLDIHHADENHQNNNMDNLRCVCIWCHGLHNRCNILINVPKLIIPDLE